MLLLPACSFLILDPDSKYGTLTLHSLIITNNFSLSSLILSIALLLLLVPKDEVLRVLDLVFLLLVLSSHDLLDSHVLSLSTDTVVASSSFDDSFISEVEGVLEGVH